METTNDTATTEQSNPVEETATETTTTPETQSNELSQVLEGLTALGEKVNAIEGRVNRQSKKKDTPETPQKTNSDNSDLSEKYEALTLQVNGIAEADELKLARDLQSETGLSIEKLLSSKYFKSELEDLRTAKANAEATGNISGDKTSGGNIKQTAEYWIAKGESPTREQVPDRKVRAEIRKGLVNKEKGSTGTFYNS